MNRKAAVGTQGVSGAWGTLHILALPRPGFAARLEEATCILWGYSLGHAWGVPAACGTPAFSCHGAWEGILPFFFSGVSLVDTTF